MHTAENLIKILNQEVEGFTSAVSRAEAIRSSIFKHDWKSLTHNIEKMDRLSGYLRALEKERVHVFEKLRREVGESAESGFYTVVVRLPEAEQNTLSKLFRQLKGLVLQLQGLTWSIDAYTRSLSSTIYDILQEIFPHRRGTMYSKTGRKRANDSDPLVINRQL
jgi:hypothetical protein